MTTIATLIVLVLVVAAFLWERRQQAADQQAREQAWVEERRELLNRVQAPERIPLPASIPFEIPEHEPDEYGLVNQVLEMAEPGAE